MVIKQKNDERFIYPKGKSKEFSSPMCESEFIEITAGSLIFFNEDGLSDHFVCINPNLPTENENKQYDKKIKFMIAMLEEHIKNEIETLVEIERVRIEAEVRKKYPEFKPRIEEES